MAYAYVTEPGSTVHRRRGAIEVERKGCVLARWPVHHLDGLVLLGGVHVSTPAMKTLLRRGLPVAVISSRGGLVGRLTPARDRSVAIRLGQYALARDSARCLHLSIRLVRDKLQAMQQVLRRYADNYGIGPFGEAMRACRQAGERACRAGGLGQLRGIEGAAGARYFQALSRANRSDLPFDGRRARPPRDPVNAMLSFAYVLLGQELSTAIDAVGLEPQLGFYHVRHGNRPALALDLMEPYRHHVADRFVLRVVNRGQYRSNDFVGQPQQGIRLSAQAVKRFLSDYEEAIQQPASPAAAGSTSPSWRVSMRREAENFAMQMRGQASSSEPCPPALADGKGVEPCQAPA